MKFDEVSTPPLITTNSSSEKYLLTSSSTNLDVSGTNSDSYQKIFQKKIIDQLEIQQPDFLIISAGFDAHKDDPLANIHLDDQDFLIITRKLKIIADKYCDGKVLSMLEGGYNINALENAMISHIRELQE